MRPRRWDVVRLGALSAACCLLASACGQARLAAPPTPEFTSGQRADPTIVTVPEWVSEGELILPADVEDDFAAGETIDVGRMIIVDDAGNASPNVSGWSRFDDAIRRRLGGNQAFGVAVMIDGRLVHESAVGDRIPGADPVEPTDRFRVASISKTITAIVTMQLVERGVLTLDEPIGTVLTDHLGITDPDPDVASTTVRDLLSHTAGFPKHESTFFGTGATSCTDAAIQGLSGNVSSSSGYRYSNMSYCALGLLIESVTGKAYERVVDELLLEPLGIGGMRITSTYELGPDEVSHAVTPGRNFMETLGAAGAWNATAADLVTIVNSLDHDTPGWKAVSEETARSMRHRVDVGLPPSGYGLGIINYENDAWGHTGTIQNTHAMVLHQADGMTWAITVAGSLPSSTGQLRTVMRNAIADAFGAGSA